MTDVTIASVFTAVSSVTSGLVEGALSFVSSMWANPIGQIGLVIGLSATVIGLGKSLFFRKRHIGA